MQVTQNAALAADFEILSVALIEALKDALKTHSIKEIFGPGDFIDEQRELT